MIDAQLLISGVIFGLSSGQHLLPDDDRAVAVLRPDAHHQPRPAAVLLDRRLHHLLRQPGDGNVWLGVLAGMVVARPRRFGGGTDCFPAHLRSRPDLQHDHVVRRADRRRRRHQVFLGPGAASGAGADRRSRSSSSERKFPVYRLVVIGIAVARLCRHLAVPQPHHHRQGDPRRHRGRRACRRASASTCTGCSPSPSSSPARCPGWPAACMRR